jgi:hypothetical protein
LLGWWNLIFIVPFGIALTYLGVYISTGITFGDADLDVDADADVDHDINADADADHDADHDADADDNSGRLSAASLAMLHLIGVGKVPLSLLVMILLFTWGICGFAAVQYLRPIFGAGDKIALYAIPFAGWMAVCITALGARLFAKLVPMHVAPAMALNDLVGQRGVAVLNIDDVFGLAQIVNPGGAKIQVPCRVPIGEDSIAQNTSIVVERFDRDARVFYVTTLARHDVLRTPLRAVTAGV